MSSARFSCEIASWAFRETIARYENAEALAKISGGLQYGQFL